MVLAFKTIKLQYNYETQLHTVKFEKEYCESRDRLLISHLPSV